MHHLAIVDDGERQAVDVLALHQAPRLGIDPALAAAGRA